MTTRMLIDGRHPEETRVAVVKGSRIEEFDFEAAARKQIKGNIYLAKVTRVEPSLQAAFIDYGGNRHGFLAFSEIHPDYYQIPREDREALLREEQRLVEESGHHHDDHDDHHHDDHDDHHHDDGGRDDGGREAGEPGENGEPVVRPEEHGNSEEAGAEALRRRRMALRRRYKIQEVIRRRQVMLVQVVKEERGNKGAALTTYISLAGRYSVLMPNTAQGGGISRKIANAADRKRLKSIMSELDLPPTMGAIVRTAGLERTKTEIRRDFDYLTRLWDGIRDNTLNSTAPALIYEDSDLVKRAIRDIYSRDIDEVLVDGEESYRQAKDFMKLLMPSHARRVQLYADPVPLFHRAGVESQLAALMNPVVNLKSGGYIVINPTEALVAVDVNSGRSTREYNIEETALKTNIEAAEEVARQLRLRDMAGLVVVDFIDMESHGNNRKVERALKEALKHDRARIQVGRISSFGLLEMSRQRLRTGVLEASTQVCHMCEGTGLVRTDGSAALAALRLLEEEAVRGRASLFRLRADRSVAIYMLNRKRLELSELEDRYGISIEVMPDETLIGGRVQIDSSGPPPEQAPRPMALAAPPRMEPDEDEPEDIEEPDDEDVRDDARGDGRESRGDGRRDDRGADRGEARGEGRNRRRRRRGGRDRSREGGAGEETPALADEAVVADAGADAEGYDGEAGVAGGGFAADGGEEGNGDRKRRRRRRRRGGRRDGQDGAEALHADALEDGAPDDDSVQADAPVAAEAPLPEPVAEETAAEAPAKPKRPRRKKADAGPAVAEAAVPEAVAVEAAEAPVADEVKPKRTRRKKADAEAPVAVEAEVAAEAPAKAAPKPRRARKPKAEAAPEAVETAAVEAEAVEAEAVVEAAPVQPAAILLEAEAVEAPAAAAPEAEAADDGAPPRKGWWNRTFGNR